MQNIKNNSVYSERMHTPRFCSAKNALWSESEYAVNNTDTTINDKTLNWSEACHTYIPVRGSVSFVTFTTHTTNPRILHRCAKCGPVRGQTQIRRNF